MFGVMVLVFPSNLHVMDPAFLEIAKHLLLLRSSQ